MNPALFNATGQIKNLSSTTQSDGTTLLAGTTVTIRCSVQARKSDDSAVLEREVRISRGNGVLRTKGHERKRNLNRCL